MNKDGPAQKILKVGRVWTGDREHPEAEAIALRGGEVAAVGSMGEMERYRGPKTVLLDHPKSFVMPGLIDAHGHIAELGAEREQIDLRGGGEPGRGRPSGEGGGRGPSERTLDSRPQLRPEPLYPGGEFPERRRCSTRLAERGRSGSSGSTAMPVGPIRRPCDWRKSARTRSRLRMGRFLKGDKAGEPTGILVDGAMGATSRRIVPPPSKDAIARRLLKAQEICLAAGLTGVHDASVSPAEAGGLSAAGSAGEAQTARLWDGLAALRGRGRIRPAGRPSRGRKGAGSRCGRSSFSRMGRWARAADYCSRALCRRSRQFGARTDRPGRLEGHDDRRPQARLAGLHTCDRRQGECPGARRLRGGPEVPCPTTKDARLRVEHAQVVRKEDVGAGARSSTSSSPPCNRRIPATIVLGRGPARARYECRGAPTPGRWFVDEGVPLAFGSDFPVEIVNPFWGISAAISRRDAKGSPPGGWHPEQKHDDGRDACGRTMGGSAFASVRRGSARRVEARISGRSDRVRPRPVPGRAPRRRCWRRRWRGRSWTGRRFSKRRRDDLRGVGPQAAARPTPRKRFGTDDQSLFSLEGIWK